MANTAISNLTAAAALTGAEIVPVVQSANTVRTTVTDIATFSNIPAGLTTQVQFNNGSVFGGAAEFTYDSGTFTLTVPTIQSAPANVFGNGTPLTLNGAGGNGGGTSGGNVALNGGVGLGGAVGGSVVINAGAGSSSGVGGNCEFTAGTGDGAPGGNFIIEGGNSVSDAGGDVTIAPGAGGTVYGELNLADGVNNLVTVFYDASISRSKLSFFGSAPVERPTPITANPAEGLFAISSALNDLGLIVNGTMTSIDADFNSTNNGFVPASGGGTTNYLRADGTFADPTAATALGFFGTTPVAQPASVPVTAAGIHAALVSLGLIT